MHLRVGGGVVVVGGGVDWERVSYMEIACSRLKNPKFSRRGPTMVGRAKGAPLRSAPPLSMAGSERGSDFCYVSPFGPSTVKISLGRLVELTPSSGLKSEACAHPWSDVRGGRARARGVSLSA